MVVQFVKKSSEVDKKQISSNIESKVLELDKILNKRAEEIALNNILARAKQLTW